MSLHHPHHNYPNHGRPHRLSPTGGDSHSGSLFNSPGHPESNPTLLTSSDPVSNSPSLSNTNPTAQRSTPVPYDPLYYLPVQQQQTHPPNPTYHSYQQPSGARYRSDQMHGSSYNRASPSSSSADPWRPPSLDVPWGGRPEGPPHYPSLCSPQSVYSPASSFLQYQPPASFYHPAELSPSREAVPTAANTQCQQSVGVGHASLDRTTSSSRGLSYAHVLTAPSLVPHDVPSETADPTIKKRPKRADARQLEALNKFYAHTEFPSTEERLQLARDLNMSARSVQIWFKNKRQASRQGGNLPNPPIKPVTVIPPPVSTVPAFLAVLAILTAAFVVART